MSNELMTAIDSINKTQGKYAFQFAGMGTKRRWARRKEYCSPHYTTRLEDVLKA